ncbi:MAG: hypothetical protein IJ831_10930 [Spirochaetales bacterium]|nr:hypothetical protein [Spirochaetales bacterium]
MSFEHLRATQPQLADRLSLELEKGLVPQCVLFAGSPYSGKMTAAVELAMTLLGQSSHFSTLDTSDLVIISSRDTNVRVRAAIADFRRKRNRRSLEILLFQLRVLLFSFHQSLLDSGDKSLFERAAAVSELLYDIDPELEEKRLGERLDKLEKEVLALLDKRGGKGLFNIDQIRLIHSYLMYDSSREKCVILENIEDVTPGAMNSILKLLEEPPQGAHIILVSKNMGRILDTILSRVRKYQVMPIRSDLEREFLTNVLFAPMDISSIEDYYYTLSGFDSKRLEREASSFVDLIERKENTPSAAFSSLCSFLEPYSAYDRFLSKVIDEIRKRALASSIPLHLAARYVDIISRCSNEAITYNQNRRVMLERISKELSDEQ